MEQRWQAVANAVAYHNAELQALRKEWEVLKGQCQHPKLPKRAQLEEYSDTCPDCGFVAYCFSI